MPVSNLDISYHHNVVGSWASLGIRCSRKTMKGMKTMKKGKFSILYLCCLKFYPPVLKKIVIKHFDDSYALTSPYAILGCSMDSEAEQD